MHVSPLAHIRGAARVAPAGRKPHGGGAETEHPQQPSSAQQRRDVEAEALVDDLLVRPGQGTAPVGRNPVAALVWLHCSSVLALTAPTVGSGPIRGLCVTWACAVNARAAGGAGAASPYHHS